MKNITVLTALLLLASTTFCVASGDLIVNGEIKVGNSASLCDNTNEGRMRYNASDKVMEFCNGTEWLAFGAAATPPPSTGPDAYTTLLLHLDSATGFADASSAAHTATNNGVAINTNQKQIGTASGYFNGSSFLSFADSEDWNFGSGDFTIDFWIKRNAISSASETFVGQGTGSGPTSAFGVGLHTTNQPVMSLVSAASGSPSVAILHQTAITDTNWHHLAYVRYGDNIYIFLDGGISPPVSLGAGFTVRNSSASLAVGRSGDVSVGYYINALVDEVRISKGIARWTSNFTPPTAPY